MNSRLALAVAGWLLAAVLATGTGVAVLGLLGRPLTGSAERLMTAEEIRVALAQDTPLAQDTRGGSPGAPSPAAVPSDDASAGPSGVRTPGAAPATWRRLVSTDAGSVIARCDGELVRLQSWTPAQGFEVDDVDPGPDDRARVKFESDEDRLEVEVRCSGGVPVPRITRHDG
ncbi:septum formation initiator [Microbispora hainanensis]|uniref:Septum formation initiator n=1 Tax=Microbispora hainanensis TaxID=568844 RepID=A0A544YXH4_9ACTN|nr:septum formation initiator [Microbispora hainanensis]TQS21473.1 septum formation initiator [Microbispora hainanensis]